MGNERNLVLCLDMLVDPLRVCHILQHDFAHLERSLSKPNFKDLDIPPL